MQNMTIRDLEIWRKDFDTWQQLANHLGYGVRHIEKIRSGECPIPARIELQWLRSREGQSRTGGLTRQKSPPRYP